MVPQTLVWALRALPLLAGVTLMIGACMAFAKQKVSSPYGVVPGVTLMIADALQLMYGYGKHASLSQLFVVEMFDLIAVLIIFGAAYHMLRTLRMTTLGLLYGGLALLSLNMTFDVANTIYVVQHKAGVPAWLHVVVLAVAAFMLAASFTRWVNTVVVKTPQPY